MALPWHFPRGLLTCLTPKHLCSLLCSILLFQKEHPLSWRSRTGKGQYSEAALWCPDRSGSSPQCSSKAPSLCCFWKQPLSTTRLSSRQVLRRHAEGSNPSPQMLKDDLICKVYLQEPCSLNKRFLPWLQEFRCYHFLSGGAHFT